MLSDRKPTSPHPSPRAERRGSRRCKITQLLRLRPSNPETKQFVDVRGTLSVSRTGVYFQSNLSEYELGMRLYVTLPFSESPTAVSREYLAEVARLEPLATGMRGIGIKLLMELGPHESSIAPYL